MQSNQPKHQQIDEEIQMPGIRDYCSHETERQKQSVETASPKNQPASDNIPSKSDCDACEDATKTNVTAADSNVLNSVVDCNRKPENEKPGSNDVGCLDIDLQSAEAPDGMDPAIRKVLKEQCARASQSRVSKLESAASQAEERVGLSYYGMDPASHKVLEEHSIQASQTRKSAGAAASYAMDPASHNKVLEERSVQSRQARKSAPTAASCIMDPEIYKAPEVCSAQASRAEEIQEQQQVPQGGNNGASILRRSGAYSESPGGRSVRLDKVCFSSLVGSSAETLSPSCESIQGGSLSDNEAVLNASDDDIRQHECEEGLAVAQAVDDEAVPEDIEEARLMEDKGALKAARKLSFRRWASGAACAFCLFVLVITLSVTLTVDKKEDLAKQTTMVPSSSPTPAPTSFIVELPESTLNVIQADEDSPQCRAYQWLLADSQLGNYSAARKKQRFALTTLYHATQGNNWVQNKLWLNHNTHECDWLSRYIPESHHDMPILNATDICDDEGNYKILALTENELEGPFPAELCLLTQLRVLNIAHNRMTGTVPTQLGLLSNLEDFSIDFTELTGAIPTEIGFLDRLKVLLAGFSVHFPGQLPSEVGKLTRLEWVELNATGTLPTELGQLAAVKKLFLLNSGFTGTIPSEIGLLTLLDTFDLAFNKFTGTLPTELGQLTDLQFLMLEDNALSGTIPSELGYLNNLTVPALKYNMLSGQMPSELGLMDSLQYLPFDANRLSGTIPSQLGQLTGLLYLVLNENALSGTIPGQLESLNDNLIHFDVSNNSGLVGSIPSELCELQETEQCFRAVCGMLFDCSVELCGCGNCTC